MLKFFFSVIVTFLFGCASMAPQKEPDIQQPAVRPQPTQGKDQVRLVEDTENVDVAGVRRALDLNVDRENLGYFEKVFDTCEIGNGYSKVKNCRKKIFVLIQFRLQCRDSEGTTSEIVTADNLTEMASQDLTWSLKAEKGEARTDSHGYASLQFIASTSQRGQRVRIGNRSDFLYLKSDEIKQVILPKYWCH